jgi:hypothetical protein
MSVSSQGSLTYEGPFIDARLAEVWRNTGELRWLKEPPDAMGYVAVVPRLQQLWFSSEGKQEWRDVPTEQST